MYAPTSSTFRHCSPLPNNRLALQHTAMATRPNSAATSQALTLLGQFTDSIDSLPHDLTKAFGDLRELDAVLRSKRETTITEVM